MLQWLRLYTLGSRGSRELKTFLEIRLISSRIDQKFKNRGEIHGFLKGELAQICGQYRRSWGLINGILRAVPSGDVVASIPLQFGGEFGFNFRFNQSHNRAAIGHRS